jgi:hypothetical protein
MATRMQQRRGTAQQWTDADPILAAGEIGFEVDTNQFKIGDGVNHWSDLSYFKNLEDLGGSLDDYILLTEKGLAGGVASLDINGLIPISQLPGGAALDAEVQTIVDGALDDINQNITELNDNLSTALNTHSIDSTNVHGIENTADLATKAFVGSEIGTHNQDSTNVHGIEDTNALATKTYADDAVSSHNDQTADVHGIADTAALATKSYADDAVTTHNNDTTGVHGITNTADLATKTYADDAVSAEADLRATAVTNAIQDANAYTDSAIEDEVAARNTAIDAHVDLTQSVHGIADTAALATKVYADNAVSTHNSDTTDVHGIADTSALATKSYADNAVSTHEQDTTSIHGIADTSLLATKEYADNAASAAVAAVIDAAPEALNTLNELAASLADDANYATTVTNALALKAPLANPTFTGTVSGITKGMVGLGNVENTADADKPISTATQTALNAKLASSTAASTYAPIDSPTFTGTVAGVTKAMVGLGNVDNTTDAGKPVSTATQAALNLKADLAGPTLTGTTTTADLVVNGDFTVNGTNFSASATSITIEDNMVQLAHQNPANTVDLGVVVAYNDGTAKHAGIVRDVSDSKWKLFKGVTSEPTTTVNFAQGSLDDLAVAGLEATSLTVGDVSNTEFGHLNGVTSNIQTQLDAKLASSTAASTYAPIANPTFTGTVSGVTKSHVGLGNVDNTSDANKPVSTATQTALDAKAPLASPALTGVPTAPTAAAGTNTTQVATTAFVGTAVADLVASAPSALNTLNELATALGNDASFSTTVTNSLASKAPTASPTFTGAVTVSSSGIVFTDGTQTKEGVPSRTPIIQKSASYTLSDLAERDDLIEMGSSSAMTLTIPANSAVAFPVGTSIDILQTSTGQVTIAGAAGVTVNATPGLKLRTQWSACTLFKRASDTWVVYGDLSA